MKKYFLLVLFIVLGVFLLTFANSFKKRFIFENRTPIEQSDLVNLATGGISNPGISNPASTYCEENGGELEIITNSDGSQFGLCKFDDYSCEEWTFRRGECDIEGDAEKIEEALIEKGLDLSGMEVKIFQHLGKYIEGGVVPVSFPAGGGYVFAVKENEEVKIVADGNGVIFCNAFVDYPDFPSYLISSCLDDSGNPVSR